MCNVTYPIAVARKCESRFSVCLVLNVPFCQLIAEQLGGIHNEVKRRHLRISKRELNATDTRRPDVRPTGTAARSAVGCDELSSVPLEPPNFQSVHNYSEPTVSKLPRMLRRHPEIWVALVLFMASNAFVYTFAQFVRWNTGRPAGLLEFCTWDCNWFRFVVDSGYDVGPNHPAQGSNHTNWSFLPLFPISALPLRYGLGFSTGVALVLTSKLELLGAIICFLMMLRNKLEDIPEYFFAGSLVAFNPYVIYAHAGYSEPLYFSLASIGFLLLDRKRWMGAGIVSAFLSASRIVGCVFSLSYFILALKELAARRVPRERCPIILIGLLFCPLGLAIFSLYLYRHTGDALGFIHSQVAWGRVVGDPLEVLGKALAQHRWQRISGLMALAGIATAAWFFWRRRPELGVFLLATTLISLSGGLWGFPRYLWWQPPLLYAIFLWLKPHRSWWGLYLAFACGMASFMVVEWFAHTNMVI